MNEMESLTLNVFKHFGFFGYREPFINDRHVFFEPPNVIYELLHEHFLTNIFTNKTP